MQTRRECAPQEDATPFRFFRHLNDPVNHGLLGHRGSIDELSLRSFEGDSLGLRFARALGARRAVPMKEVLEAFEFFAAVRKELRSERLVDVCAGHGLLGVLFALYERKVQEVRLIDHRTPASRSAVLEAAAEVGPWTKDKLVSENRRLQSLAGELEEGTSVLSIHACGERTDAVIGLGLECAGNLAVMPCCHSHRASKAPGAIRRALGTDLAIDIDRTYRLEQAGYTVRWSSISPAITPMNRVIVGRVPKAN